MALLRKILMNIWQESKYTWPTLSPESQWNFPQILQDVKIGLNFSNASISSASLCSDVGEILERYYLRNIVESTLVAVWIFSLVKINWIVGSTHLVCENQEVWHSKAFISDKSIPEGIVRGSKGSHVFYFYEQVAVFLV